MVRWGEIDGEMSTNPNFQRGDRINHSPLPSKSDGVTGSSSVGVSSIERASHLSLISTEQTTFYLPNPSLAFLLPLSPPGKRL